MPNLPISQLPLASSGYPDSWMVIVNYDVVPSGVTYKIPYTAVTYEPPLPYQPTYGIFTQTGNSVSVSATTVETTILDGGVGTLNVGANQFRIGDSFRAILGGTLSVGNNQTLRLKVKSGSVILADSGLQSITNITNDIFHYTIDFTIRNIGTTGVADIVTIGNFKYTKTSNGSVEGFAFNTINNTTFDTTISNTLDITAQWGSTDSTNSIITDIFTLTKIY